MTEPTDSALRRRTLFASAGAVGALAAAAVVLPAAQKAQETAAKADPLAKDQGGYQLTDHVKQYYASARI